MVQSPTISTEMGSKQAHLAVAAVSVSMAPIVAQHRFACLKKVRICSFKRKFQES